MSADVFIPFKLLFVNASQPPIHIANLDLRGFASWMTQDDPTAGETTLHISAEPAIYSGDTAQADADFTVTEVSGDTYVGSSEVFTLDRNLHLPSNPKPGKKVIWADECATAGGSLGGGHKLIASGDANIQNGTVSASTFEATSADWGAGVVITFFFNGTFWKVIK